jgi:hypothetical protein
MEVLITSNSVSDENPMRGVFVFAVELFFPKGTYKSANRRVSQAVDAFK